MRSTRCPNRSSTRRCPSLVNHPIAKEVADNELRRQAAEFNQAFFAALSSQRPSRFATRWALQGEIQEGLRLFDVLSTIGKKLNSYQPREGSRRPVRGAAAADCGGHIHGSRTIQCLSPRPPSGSASWPTSGLGEIGGLKLTYRPLEVQSRLQIGSL